MQEYAHTTRNIAQNYKKILKRLPPTTIFFCHTPRAQFGRAIVI